MIFYQQPQRRVLNKRVRIWNKDAACATKPHPLPRGWLQFGGGLLPLRQARPILAG